MRSAVNTRILYTFLSALTIILGSIVAIRVAQGYRISLSGEKSVVKGTGLLVANSFPTGAEVYVDGKLMAATDETIYLDPGQYQLEIKKDGYTSWQKELKVEKELVTQTNAQLFRLATSLTPLTFTGVTRVSPSPDGEKLIFYTASASAATRNGLYVLQLNNNLLARTSEARQVAEETVGFDLSKAEFIWAPDSSQVMMFVPGHEVLLDLNKKNVLSSLPDVTFQKKQILSEWESELYLRERQFMSKFPPEVLKVATESARNVYLSPDKKKIVYMATASATLPENISPALPARSSQPEQRTLQPGSTYIYDREEDRNFLIDLGEYDHPASSSAQRVLLASDLFNKDPISFTASPSSFQRLQATTSAQTVAKFQSYYSPLFNTGLQWFPDSRHVIFSNQNQVYTLEYDNTNKTLIYEGPFADKFLYAWPDGSKLLILTSFSSNSPQNLYGIELK